MKRKFTIKDGEIFINLEEAADTLRYLARNTRDKSESTRLAIYQVADLFDQIKNDSLKQLERLNNEAQG